MATQFHRAFGACMNKKKLTKDEAERLAAERPSKKAYRCPTYGQWHIGKKRKAGHKKVRA